MITVMSVWPSLVPFSPNQSNNFETSSLTLPLQHRLIYERTVTTLEPFNSHKTTKFKRTHRPKRTTPHHPHKTTKHHHSKRTTTRRPHRPSRTTKFKRTHRPTRHPTKHTTPNHHHTRRTTKRKPHHPPKHTPTPFSTTEDIPIDMMGGGATTTESPSAGSYDLELTWDDATWVLIQAFIIFTMQSGFGLLESGCCSSRNESHIMMKNAVDIVFGGLTYWLFGFSFTFGSSPGSNPFIGVGEYVVDSGYDILGPVMTTYFFQLSFATTATTIVSGAMAERCNFKAYCIFSLLNTVVYCVPARWIWGPGGFLSEMGCIDIAGSGAVHLLGGASAYTAAWMLGPRLGRYELGKEPLPLGNPTNCIVGLYILWWGWLAFNSGSTFGVVGDKWKFACRAAVTTVIASIGGGLVGSIRTLLRPSRIFDVMDIVNSVLGGLVGVTAGCALYHTFDSLVVGIIGGIVTLATSGFADWTGVDDPVGATAVHGFGGIWGLLAVGFFAEEDGGVGFSKGNSGLLRGGGWYLLGIQALASVCIIGWAFLTTFVILWVINLFIPIRMEPYEELLGADFVDHLIRRKEVGITPILSVMGSHPHLKIPRENAGVVGKNNPTHDTIIETITEIGGGRKRWNKLKNVVTALDAVSTKEKRKFWRKDEMRKAEKETKEIQTDEVYYDWSELNKEMFNEKYGYYK